MNDLADGLTFDERLKERQHVRLDVVESGRGPRAANIQAATD